MAYPETIRYLESFINYEKIPAYPYKESLKLERIRDFLREIGNPQDGLKCIHVAGTKGKGSTCAFLTYILRQAGYRVGLYTSPHLSDFRERIRVLNAVGNSRYATGDFEGMISEDELRDLVTRLKPTIDRYNKHSLYGPLSFFEVYTALAFVYFQGKKVDFAVLETGLGGRLDATNVVDPLVCAITPISYEHTQKLGHTLREIAREKAGIIKSQNCIVITAPQEKEAIEVIRNKCKEVGAKLYEINQNKYPRFQIKLPGEHQQINANVATEVIKALRFYGIKINRETIKKGLYHTVWPGRCEVVSKNPLIVLDGAQNVASSRALKQTIKEKFSATKSATKIGGLADHYGERGGSAKGGKYKKLILVLGISNDKDILGICKELCPLADEIILTQARNPRAASADNIEQVMRNQKPEHRNQIIKTKNVKEAKEKALDIANKEDLILVTGSLFVVGEIRNLIPPRRWRNG